MRLVKRLLLFILILVLVGGTIYWANLRGYINIENQIFKKIEQGISQLQNNDSLQNVASDAQYQSKILTDRAKETGSHIQQVLGESVQVNEDAEKEALHQRALNYGRYLYCKTVVEEYENQTSNQN